jgi:UDP-2,3-diacylglucosamine pyrophosphatase LpxH
MKPRTPEEVRSISSILTSWERAADHNYDDRFDGVLTIDSGHDGVRGDIVVISDLHIGSGLDPSNNFTGNENFFADGAMKRFLTTVAQKRKENVNIAVQTAPMTLIINGDFIDFLRITDYPDSDTDFTEWLRAIQLVGITEFANKEELNNSITVEQKQGYGLKTNDFKSVWKLHVSAGGHAKVFQALGDWLADGHKLIITKGNHDLEWFWQAVRNYLRFILAEHLEVQNNIQIEAALQSIVLPRVRFIENAFILDDTLYVEHGHRYDKFTKLRPESERVYHDKELNYPLGSYFNRYLINKIELHYPYFENVRPRESLLPLIIKTDFPLAIRVFFKYIPYLVRSIMRRQAWKIFAQTLAFGLVLSVGLAIVLLVVLQMFGTDVSNVLSTTAVSADNSSTVGSIVGKYLLALAETVGGLILTYYLGRILSMAQLVEPSSLYSDTKKLFEMYPGVQIVTLGHTHNPEQFMQQNSGNDNSRWFYNTGTWIPIVDTTTGSLREDKTYTYLYFTHDAAGKILPRPLHRWDDGASRGETLTLIEIKEG